MAPRLCSGVLFVFVFVLVLPQLRAGPTDSSPSARSMLGRIQAQAFSFDQTFQPYQKDDFVMVGMGGRRREQSLLIFLGTLHDMFLEFGSNKKYRLGFLFCFLGGFLTQ